MKKFEIRTATAQIPKNKKELVRECITMASDIWGDLDDCTLESFNTLEEAQEAFYKKYSETSVAGFETYFVQEYWIEEIEYDEDGYESDFSDPIAWSTMPEKWRR